MTALAIVSGSTVILSIATRETGRASVRQRPIGNGREGIKKSNAQTPAQR